MYHVHIVNNLPGDFALHCQSGDHDLEARILHPNEEQLIRFKINFFRTTRFYCAARWGRYKQFDDFGRLGMKTDVTTWIAIGPCETTGFTSATITPTGASSIHGITMHHMCDWRLF
ncbi:hypothetical protein NL676_019265 [Syzygium grande]|nr:hypothetical protein NL676_019265 [Syzygium grande]